MSLHATEVAVGAGDTAVVAGVAGRQLNILEFYLRNTDTITHTVTVKDGVGGATLWIFTVPGNFEVLAQFADNETYGLGRLLTAGNALSMKLEAAGNVNASIDYGTV